MCVCVLWSYRISYLHCMVCVYVCVCTVVIQDILRDFPAVFLVDVPFDAHVSQLGGILRRVMASDGLFTLRPSGHSVYAATHPDLYGFLPTDTGRLMAIRMWAFTTGLVYNTKTVYKGVLYWWYLCALDKRCVEPHNITSPCPLVVNNPSVDQFSTYFSRCHRHDQSAINVLAANHYDYRVSMYTMYQPEIFMQLHKNDTKNYQHKAKVCSI